jgi:hypothetical protein
MSLRGARRYTKWIAASTRQFEVDPFLLAAVIHRRSRCRAARKQDDALGLAGISYRMHARFIKRRHYHYWVWEGERWKQQRLPIKQHAFTPRTLSRPEPNIYFAAALLSIYERQCSDLDKAFDSVAHRHHVSHFVWGDRIHGTIHEDEILQDRRRLLRYYVPEPPAPRARYRGVEIHPPLDGSPRRISSGYSTRRARGRRHRGVDFYSSWGEPVRAVADGIVSFAGVQPRRRRAISLTPGRARRYPRWRMGIGGLFVLVKHGRALTSGYFHLSGFNVKRGDRINAGQILGYVGRTGIKSSPSHLHFELRLGGRNINPTRILSPYLIWPGKNRHRRLSSQLPAALIPESG